MKVFELVAEEGELGVDLSAVLDHLVDLVGESHVLCLLGDKVGFDSLFEYFYFFVDFDSRLFGGSFGLVF